nr:hypothetical protein [Tanacetum cinerariifolium]
MRLRSNGKDPRAQMVKMYCVEMLVESRSNLEKNKWYQSLLRSFDQKKNNTQVRQILLSWTFQRMTYMMILSVLNLIKKEKEGLDSKLTGFESASKDLDTLLGSQRSDKKKEGLGYSAIPLSCSTDSPIVIKTNKTKTARKPHVKYAEMYNNTSKSPKFDHLAYDCGVWVEKGENWSKNNFAHKNVTPRADLFKTASVSAARSVNTAAPRPNVNSVRPKTTQDLMIIKLILRVKRLERELKARTPPTKIQKVDVKGRSRSVMAWVPKKV